MQSAVNSRDDNHLVINFHKFIEDFIITGKATSLEMCVYLLDTTVSELFVVITSNYRRLTYFLFLAGKGCDDQADICLAKHNPTGSLLAIKRIPLDKCALEISTIQVSFNHFTNAPYSQWLKG